MHDPWYRSRWFRVLLAVGAFYLVVGIALGALAGAAGSLQGAEKWRRAAWLVSAIAFAGQIAYEQLRLRSSPRATALHSSLASALGSFGLAVAANLHAHPSSTAGRLALALVAWPLLTLIPAFLVAFVLAAVVSRLRDDKR